MAYTNFVRSLEDAIFKGNLTEINSILSKATIFDWTQANTSLGKSLIDLTNSNLSALNKATIAQTLVSKAYLNGPDIEIALNSFMQQNNLMGIRNILNAADVSELNSISQFTYGHLLTSLTSTTASFASQAATAQLIVSKGFVNGDSLGFALAEFIKLDNLQAANVILNSMDASEIASVNSFHYGRALMESLDTVLSGSDEANLAKLIVQKGTVDGQSLGFALNEFIAQDNLEAATNILNAMDASERGSVNSFHYGRALMETLDTVLSGSDEANLAKLIVEKGTVDGLSLGNALQEFIRNDNVEGATNILNSMSASERASVNSFDYFGALLETTNTTLNQTAEANLAKLIVEKGTLQKFHIEQALTEFANIGNMSAVNNIINAASFSEKNDFDEGVLLRLENANYRSTNDIVTGDQFANALYGFKGNDTLRGGLGNDFLNGGDGNDKLYGDDGNDIIAAAQALQGADKDYVDGGAGRDAIVFDLNMSEVVVDFEQGNINVDFLVRSNFGSETSVKNIEVLHFNDGAYLVSDLLKMAQTGNTSDNVML